MSSAVASLAFLKVAWDREQRDYIDNWLPFVLHAVAIGDSSIVSLPAVQETIRQEFGLSIPQHVLDTVIRRATRQEYFYRRDHELHRYEKVLVESDLTADRRAVERDFQALLEQLSTFAGVRFEAGWSTSDAEVALTEFLEKRSTEAVATLVGGHALPAPPDSELIVSSFVTHAMEADPKSVELLDTVVRGAFLANTVLYPNLGEVSRRFSELTVYLDTTFLLRALGYTNEAQAEACRELLRLLHEQHARLACFTHTRDEILGVLSGIARRLGRGDTRRWFGETFEFFIDEGKGASDAELAIARLNSDLETLFVRVVEKPEMEVELSVDERRLREVVGDEVRHKRQDALDKDVESITAIHRLRRGRFFPSLEDAVALFVTTNSALQRASNRFAREEYPSELRANPVPWCMLDWVLTTLVWLKSPEAAPDLPLKRLVADAYAAIRPPDELWQEFLREVERLEEKGDVTEQDADVLRYGLTARQGFMELTRGRADAFVSGTVEEILDRAREAIRGEERQRRIEVETEVGRLREDLSGLETRVGVGATRIARIASWGAFWLVTLLLGLGALSSFAAEPFDLPNSLGAAMAVLATLLIFAGTANLVTGRSLLGVRESLERRLAAQIEGLFR